MLDRYDKLDACRWENEEGLNTFSNLGSIRTTQDWPTEVPIQLFTAYKLLEGRKCCLFGGQQLVYSPENVSPLCAESERPNRQRLCGWGFFLNGFGSTFPGTETVGETQPR